MRRSRTASATCERRRPDGRIGGSRSGSASRSPTSARTRRTSGTGCARHPHDFVIGSVHISARSPYKAGSVRAFVAGRSLPDIVAPYFDEVIGAARSGLFDTIGHLDFVKRYLVPHVMPADLAAAPELYEPVLAALVESRDGARGQRVRAAPAAARDLPGRADRGALPRARRPACDHRLGRASNGVVLIRARSGVSSRDRRGVRRDRDPARRRTGARTAPDRATAVAVRA